MSDSRETQGDAGAKNLSRAVFLSYASEDAQAAERICSALRSAGIEVWFDRSELRGGDAWDAAIRRQIKSCGLFMPLISGNSHARQEGYFRLEWKLAVDRSHLMATDRAFLVPVVIDDTPDADDRVPDRFRDVQWTRLPGGETTPAFVERVLRLLDMPRAVRPAGDHVAPGPSAASAPMASPVAVAAKPFIGRPALIAAMALVLLAGALVWALMRYRSQATLVVPYSLEDRRLTFAILPFQAPPDDAHGAQVAASLTSQFSAQLDEETVWAQNLPRRAVDEAAAKTGSVRALAKMLDVHFLIRGTLSKTKAGYTASTAVLDGLSERVLKSATVTVPGEALNPRWRADVDDALYDFRWAGMEEESRRTAGRPIESLDVRDLTFRAYTGWSEHHGAEAKGAYYSASELLKRALALSPDDKAATYVLAEINLCDCLLAWSNDVESQKAIGAAALDKFLRLDPQNPDMISEKANLFELRGRYEESLLIWESLLQKDPEDPFALWGKALVLLRLGRAPEALPIADGLVDRYPDRFNSVLMLATAAHYTLGDYAGAVRFAQTVATRMRSDQLSSPATGPVRLALAAAEAKLGHRERAQAALADFYVAVPDVRTIAAMRRWIWPASVFAGIDSLYDGLKAAGVAAE